MQNKYFQLLIRPIMFPLLCSIPLQSQWCKKQPSFYYSLIILDPVADSHWPELVQRLLPHLFNGAWGGKTQTTEAPQAFLFFNMSPLKMEASGNQTLYMAAQVSEGTCAAGIPDEGWISFKDLSLEVTQCHFCFSLS